MLHDELDSVALDPAGMAHEHLIVSVHHGRRVALPMERAAQLAPTSVSLIDVKVTAVVLEDGADGNHRPHLLLRGFASPLPHTEPSD